LILVALAFLIGTTLSTLALAKPARLLALGDSLTAGFMLPEKDGFPAALQHALRAEGVDIDVTNAGVSGDTSTAALDRLDWALEPGIGFAIVEVGANDMLRGVDTAITRKAISTILSKLKAKGIKPLLAGMIAAPGMGRDYEAKFNAIFPELAREFDVPLYPFFLDGVAGQPGLQLGDGMHPNAAGVRIIVERILPSVKALLGAPAGKS
jgi:acyl-CoA thioesterase-1